MKDQAKKSTSLWARIAYGAADIYGGGAFVIIGTFFTVFMTKSQGMSPILAGTIPLVGKIWDAVTDPIMGNITDRTHSRFGAKRFYLLIGSFASALTFFGMWTTVNFSSPMAQYWYYILMYCLFSTGFTIVMVPYNALLPDMISDYTMRSKFSGVRIICSTFGAILAGLIPSIIIKDNTDASLYLKVAVIFSIIFLIVVLVTFFGTWEKQKPVIKISIGQSFIQSFTVFRSRAFRIFVAIFIFGQGSADFLTGLAVYYVDDVLHAYGGGHFTYLMAVILLAQFVGTILFTPIMAKTSKRFPILVGFPLRMVCTLAMLFFSYEGVNFIIILILSFLIGLGMSASSVSIFALLTDMADVDELITTVNRPGICSGMATFIRKIGAGLVSALIGILLTMVGYSGTLAGAGEMQSAATQQGITMIYVFGPVIMMAVTLYYAKKFPMDKKEFDVIKREIGRRKGEDTSSPTAEEIKVCENVTGMKFDELWNKENAFQLHTQKMKEEN